MVEGKMTSAATAQVYVDLAPGDIRAAYRAQAPYARLRGFVLGVVAVLGAIFVADQLMGPAGAIVVFVLAEGALLFVIRRARRTLRGRATSMRSHIVVDSRSLRTTGEHSRTEFDWPAFDSKRLTDRHLFLRLPNGNQLIIPRRCFETENDEAAFLAIVTRCLPAGPDLVTIRPEPSGSPAGEN